MSARFGVGECNMHSRHGFAWGNTSACLICRASRTARAAKRQFNAVLDAALETRGAALNYRVSEVACQFGVSTARVSAAFKRAAIARQDARSGKL